MFDEFYAGKRVLVTGHTGFKGGWLSLWLKRLGAKVAGYSLEARPEPNFYSIVRSHTFEQEFIGDIRDFPKFQGALGVFRPEIIFHLAAQSLVRRSYDQPSETFAINSIGTLNVLEAVRLLKLPAALVLVTTDKCYENKEWHFSYRENDALGGLDPYSASKAAAEIVVQSWRESFFKNSPELGAIATARAGNVIGGGDYAEDRIVPDAIRALLGGQTLLLRNLHATRPWQHVLDCLDGYLLLAKKLREHRSQSEFASAFNFGPGPNGNLPVSTLVEEIYRILPGRWEALADGKQPHEAGKLNLAIDKAASLLNWSPTWNFTKAVEATVRWYEQRHFKRNKDMLGFSLEQIGDFENCRRKAQR